MKNPVKLFTAAIVVSLILLGCNGSNQKVDPLAMSLKKGDPLAMSLKMQDPLVASLKSIQAYMLESDAKSNGELFKYMKSNPDAKIQEAESKGWLSEAILLPQIKIVEEEVNKREGEDLFNVASATLSPDFISDSKEASVSAIRICIFCCRACLDRIRKNHCIEILFWQFGPGC